MHPNGGVAVKERPLPARFNFNFSGANRYPERGCDDYGMGEVADFPA